MLDDQQCNAEGRLFASALRRTLTNEGFDYVNNPSDTGGPTRFGITQQTLARYRSRPVLPDDVATMTLDEASAIYRQFYWQPLRTVYAGADESLVCALFDASVLCGLPQTIRCAQRALAVKADGIAGPETKHALLTAAPATLLFAFTVALCDYFLRVVEGRPTQLCFLRGWFNRALRYLSPNPRNVA